MKEVRRTSLRDFHRTRPSGSGMVTEKPPSVEKITPIATSERTGDKAWVPDVTKDDSTESEAESWKNDEDESNDENDSESEGNDEENESDGDKTQSDNEKGSDYEQETDGNESGSESDHQEKEEEVKDDEKEEGEFIHTPSHTDDKDDANLESKSDDKIEGDKDKGIDDTTIQFDADVNIEKENLEILYDQVIEDAHLTTTNVPKETEVLATSSSRSFDLASKFLIFSDIHPFDAKIVSPLDVPIHHETTNPLSILLNFALVFQFNNRIIALEKEVAKLKKDPLHTQVTALVDDHLDERMGATREEFMNFLLVSLTARIIKQVKNQLPQILPEEVSNFAPPVIEKTIEKSLKEVTLAKVSSQPQSTYEAAATLTEFELMKILIDKMDKSESYLRSCKDKDKDEDPSAGPDRGLKKRKTSKDAKPTTNSDMPQDQEGNLGNDDDKPRKEAASRRDWFTQPTQHKNPLILLNVTRLFQKNLIGKIQKAVTIHLIFPKPLPLVMSRNHQRVPVDYFINNDLKYLQGGVLTMTYTTSTTKTKAAQYDLPCIEDMVPNIWSPVKVAYDKHALWGISHWREQRKTLYGYARGLESRHDVYFTKRILAVTHVNVMRKHGYGYLEEVVVRIADNDLYRFKECDDVADFAIALRMFTRSLVIHKRVEDLQLGVESYQKHINVTRPDTTRLDLYKKHPYTPYKDTSYETDLKLLQRTI
ncbi:hypothetical protein Tco_0951384 [Tanacetum coccineum]|uniref:Uncharacterized protein n=1 Tax=Tanacetum coccineum TaxID=301880 RepID=A0ABQ5E0Q3_9ASTR